MPDDIDKSIDLLTRLFSRQTETPHLLAVKYAWIEEHHDVFNVTRMCALLEVSRSGYCQWRTRPPSDRAQANTILDSQVAAIHSASKRSYGRRCVVHELHQRSLRVGHERGRCSLRRQGLRSTYKRPHRVTTDSNHRKPVAPNVLQQRFEGRRTIRPGLPTSPVSSPARAGCIWPR